MAVSPTRRVTPRRRILGPRPDPLEGRYRKNLVSFPMVQNLLAELFRGLNEGDKGKYRRRVALAMRFLQLFPDEFITVVHNPKERKLVSLAVTQPPPRWP